MPNAALAVTRQAACSLHPTLSPEAWSEISNGKPMNDGVKALLVCKFACPVRNSCPFDEGEEMIAKGGWFDARRRFFYPPDDRLELRYAAAYIGISYAQLRSIVKIRGIKLVSGPGISKYIMMTDVRRLASTHGPRHGTFMRYELHLLQGEEACDMCMQSVKGSHDNARFL